MGSTAFTVSCAPQAKEIWSGDTIFVRSSIYIVNFCGYAPSTTRQVRPAKPPACETLRRQAQSHGPYGRPLAAGVHSELHTPSPQLVCWARAAGPRFSFRAYSNMSRPPEQLFR